VLKPLDNHRFKLGDNNAAHLLGAQRFIQCKAKAKAADEHVNLPRRQLGQSNRHHRSAAPVVGSRNEKGTIAYNFQVSSAAAQHQLTSPPIATCYDLTRGVHRCLSFRPRRLPSNEQQAPAKLSGFRPEGQRVRAAATPTQCWPNTA
jgi:hypothetical protein